MAIHNFLSFLPSSLAPPPRLFNFSSSTTTIITTTNMDLISSTRLTSQTRPRTFSVQSINTNFSAAVGKDLPVDYANWFGKADPENRRRAGVLLHPTSFPGPYGIGDLGDQAFRVLDWLHEAGCSLWQVYYSFLHFKFWKIYFITQRIIHLHTDFRLFIWIWWCVYWLDWLFGFIFS